LYRTKPARLRYNSQLKGSKALATVSGRRRVRSHPKMKQYQKYFGLISTFTKRYQIVRNIKVGKKLSSPTFNEVNKDIHAHCIKAKVKSILISL
jgi:hypothetical protein